MKKYLLDTSVFITSFWKYYGPGFVPAFWEWLEIANRRGIVFSIDMVKAELERKMDPLRQWATMFGDEFFVASSKDSKDRLLDWIKEQGCWTPNAKQAFVDKDVADPYLIALAMDKGYTVVSLEAPSENIKNFNFPEEAFSTIKIPEGMKPNQLLKAVKIPDVCTALGVECMVTHEMLRIENPTFILKKESTSGVDDLDNHLYDTWFSKEVSRPILISGY